MRWHRVAWTILFVVILLGGSAFACGVERWPVKVGKDADVARVQLAPVETTIAKLGALPAPRDPDALTAKRFPAELRTYVLSATLTLIKKEADQDYHIVVTSGGRTMIVESPDPTCAKGSRFEAQIKAVRQALDRKFGAFQHLGGLHLPVTVTGVLFWDKIHGQTGVAPNGVELHPLLDLKFD